LWQWQTSRRNQSLAQGADQAKSGLPAEHPACDIAIGPVESWLTLERAAQFTPVAVIDPNAYIQNFMA
jgi:hypothetical protein